MRAQDKRAAGLLTSFLRSERAGYFAALRTLLCFTL
jgi:hypothetical protein